MMGFSELELLLHANTTWVLGLLPAGGTSVLEKLPLIVGGAIIGGSVAWFFAKRQSLTQHRVQQELWDRKCRLAEADRESAGTSLNQSNIDVKRIKGTYEAHVQRITALQAELVNERAHVEQLQTRIDEQEHATQGLLVARDSSDAAASAARTEAEKKSRGHREIAQERDGLVARVSELEGELEQARTQITEDTRSFRASIAERDEQVVEWQRRHAEDQESTSATLAGLEERILELEPTPALLEETRLDLDESRAERARLARDNAAAIEQIEAKAAEELEDLQRAHDEAQRITGAEAARIQTELQEQLAELQPLPEQLEAGRVELELVRAELSGLLESSTAEKEAAAEDLAALLRSSQEAREAASSEAGIIQGQLQSRLASLEPLPEQLEATRLELESVRAELALLLQSSAAAETAAAEELAALRRSSQDSREAASAEFDVIQGELKGRLEELEPLPGQLEGTRLELESVRAELASLVESSAAAEEAAAAELAALRRSTQEAREAASAESGVVQGELQSRLSTLEPLPEQLEATRKNLETVRRDRDTLAESTAAEISELKGQIEQLLPLEELLTDSRGETDKLRTELANLEATSANHESELRERITELEPLREQLSATQSDLRNSRDRVSELEPLVPRLARVETELSAAGTANSSLRSSSEEEIVALEARIEELEPLVVELARREGELTVMRERTLALEPLPAQLRDREAELEALRATSEQTQDNARLRERELEQRLKQLEGIEDEFLATRKEYGDFKKAAARDARASELEAKRLATTLDELTARAAEVETLRGRLTELQASQKADQREAHQLRGQSTKLETRLTSTKLKLDEHAAQLKEARVELTKLRKVAARAEAKDLAAAAKAQSVKAQSSKAQSSKAQSSKAQSNKAQSNKAPSNKAAAGAKPRSTKAAPAPKKAPAKRVEAKENVKTIQPAPRRGQDDLTAISGIGPSYEKVLKKAGIHRFEQLATLTAPKLSALAEKIDIPVDRIKKDRWVQKAKAAHQKKYKA